MLNGLQTKVYSIVHEYCDLPPGFVPHRPEDR